MPQFPENSNSPVQQSLAMQQISPQQVQQQQPQSIDWPIRQISPVLSNNNHNQNIVKPFPIAPSVQNLVNEKPKDTTEVKAKAKIETDTNDSTSKEYNKDSEYEDDEKPTEPPKKKSRKHKKLENNENIKSNEFSKEENDEMVMNHQELKSVRSDVEKLYLEHDVHDGHEEKPGGAAFSISLGKSKKGF